MDEKDRLAYEAEMTSAVDVVSHSDFIERIRSLQDALFFTSLDPEVKRQIFKDLNDIAVKVFCHETKTN